jgi:hypothetical protein
MIAVGAMTMLCLAAIFPIYIIGENDRIEEGMISQNI